MFKCTIIEVNQVRTIIFFQALASQPTHAYVNPAKVATIPDQPTTHMQDNL